jgi:hypothetical protein
VHAEPAREDASRTLATLSDRAPMWRAGRRTPVIPQRHDSSNMGELRKSIGLRTVATARFVLRHRRTECHRHGRNRHHIASYEVGSV